MIKIEPIVKKIKSLDDSDINDLNYWLSRTPAERIEAMQILRRHYFAVTGYTKPPKIEAIAIKRP